MDVAKHMMFRCKSSKRGQLIIDQPLQVSYLKKTYTTYQGMIAKMIRNRVKISRQFEKQSSKPSRDTFIRITHIFHHSSSLCLLTNKEIFLFLKKEQTQLNALLSKLLALSRHSVKILCLKHPLTLFVEFVCLFCVSGRAG